MLKYPEEQNWIQAEYPVLVIPFGTPCNSSDYGVANFKDVNMIMI